MKKQKLIVMCGMLLSAVPFAFGQSAASVPGSWTLAFDWDCNGTYRTTPVNLHANGTFDTGGSNVGNWVQQAGMLTFQFDNSLHTTYSGNLASKSITGIQSTFDGLNGCFYMLQSGAPTASLNQAKAQKAAPTEPDEAGNHQ
jgi:hypothetical protein